jgi:uncharacterized membrane protein YtjA (UPF0391 family)
VGPADAGVTILERNPFAREALAPGKHVPEGLMLKLALFFLVISLIAALFGYTGLAAATGGIAKILFFVFLVIFVVLLIAGLAIGSTFW